MTKKKEEKKHDVKVEITVSLTGEDIDDLMAAAMEGGINYWCSEVNVVGGKYLGKFASDQISRGGELWFYDCEDESYYGLTLEKLLNGIGLFLKETGGRGCLTFDNDHYELDMCNVDANIADSIIQYALFDEEVYG